MAQQNHQAVRRLLVREVPEVADGTVEIMAIARTSGRRTKIAVRSRKRNVDPLGACIGLRGVRFKSISDQLGERIDLIRWSDSIESVVSNALQPAEVDDVFVDHARHEAMVVVREDQIALANGRDGHNKYLAGELCGLNIKITTDFRHRF
jgi:N utilization substance protein A